MVFPPGFATRLVLLCPSLVGARPSSHSALTLSLTPFTLTHSPPAKVEPVQSLHPPISASPSIPISSCPISWCFPPFSHFPPFDICLLSFQYPSQPPVSLTKNPHTRLGSLSRSRFLVYNTRRVLTLSIGEFRLRLAVTHTHAREVTDLQPGEEKPHTHTHIIKVVTARHKDIPSYPSTPRNPNQTKSGIRPLSLSLSLSLYPRTATLSLSRLSALSASVSL